MIQGAVQGVGFRPFVYRLARELDLPGWVRNTGQGVCIEVQGAPELLRDFTTRIQRDKPTISAIYRLETTYLDITGLDQFEIRESEDGEKTALILPDIATCDDCLREINNSSDRRYQYPFTNCTNCGPRFSIIEALPYDRSRTTMKKFVMCDDCTREYYDPESRRFHAQPNACPVCGPHLEWWDAAGHLLADGNGAQSACAEAIRNGTVVAVKGLGGFHLMVDARNDDAVRCLRTRKRREEKPFAVLFPSLRMIHEFCLVSEIEERLLRSPQSPIVLLRRRQSHDNLSPSLAPVNPYLGVMLPYMPLHHLLMQDLGFPVVATSGNLSEEPICTEEGEVVSRLGGIADAFLVHNRPIARHVDDSIFREIAGREMVLRRARGFAPLPIHLSRDIPPLVAVGAHQKNAVAISVGSQVFTSQHIGKLESAASLAAFQNVLGTFREIYDLKPAAVACDLHPDYVSTSYAHSMGLPVIAVQHHYAHVLSCIAENELQPPVLGIAWDGSGFGTDGTIWGGEFLHIAAGGFTRVAHLRTFRLPGGEKAVREPRRAALSILYEIFGDEAFDTQFAPLLSFSKTELQVLRAMLRRCVNSPVTSSAGRLFDAIASLLNIRHLCSFEGQAAMELEYATAPAGDAVYPFILSGNDTSGIVCDWEPMVRGILFDTDSAAAIARKVQKTLAEMAVRVAERIGEENVVLSGGCFQNRYLTETCVGRLEAAGFRVYWHRRVPPNDGGIALGQIAGAAAELSRRENLADNRAD